MSRESGYHVEPEESVHAACIAHVSRPVYFPSDAPRITLIAGAKPSSQAGAEEGNVEIMRGHNLAGEGGLRWERDSIMLTEIRDRSSNRLLGVRLPPQMAPGVYGARFHERNVAEGPLTWFVIFGQDEYQSHWKTITEEGFDETHIAQSGSDVLSALEAMISCEMADRIRALRLGVEWVLIDKSGLVQGKHNPIIPMGKFVWLAHYALDLVLDRLSWGGGLYCEIAVDSSRVQFTCGALPNIRDPKDDYKRRLDALKPMLVSGWKVRSDLNELDDVAVTVEFHFGPEFGGETRLHPGRTAGSPVGEF